MKRFLATLTLAGTLLWLAGCLPAVPQTPSAISATATPTATATTAWFPPTSTPTPLPPTFIPTPTPDLLAGAGAPLTSLLAGAQGWFAPAAYAGRFGLANGVLSITITRPRAGMIVLQRQVHLFDFYMSVQAEPQVCRGADAYGIVVRASPSGQRYYRFGVTCEGQMFADLVDNGLPIPQATPQPAGVPPGAPLRVSLAVRADGKKLVFAVNGNVLLTVDDAFPKNGRENFGVFAQASGQEGVIVAFRNLVVRPLPGTSSP